MSRLEKSNPSTTAGSVEGGRGGGGGGGGGGGRRRVGPPFDHYRIAIHHPQLGHRGIAFGRDLAPLPHDETRAVLRRVHALRLSVRGEDVAQSRIASDAHSPLRERHGAVAVGVRAPPPRGHHEVDGYGIVVVAALVDAADRYHARVEISEAAVGEGRGIATVVEAPTVARQSRTRPPPPRRRGELRRRWRRSLSAAVFVIDDGPERTDRRVGMGLDVAVFTVGELHEYHCVFAYPYIIILLLDDSL